MTRRIQICWVLLAALAALALPSGALAASQLSVAVTHSPASIPRNSELMTYTVSSRNEASPNPEVGDTLICNGVPPEWGGTKKFEGQPTEALSFTYQWLRNGAPIFGASGSIPKGGPRPTYVATSADEGRTIQCLIKGTVQGSVKTEAALGVSVPPITVEPSPVPAVPQPPETEGGTEWPQISGEATVGHQVECSTPVGWSGLPTWTFIWLRNGEEVATGATYMLTSADNESAIQCEAIGATGGGEAPSGGKAVVISPRRQVGPLPAGITQQPGNSFLSQNRQRIEVPKATAGQVRLVLELPPGGIETRVFKIKPLTESGTVAWSSCTSTEPELLGGLPARVICTTTASAAPLQAFQSVQVQASLGEHTPDPAVAKATISGGGSAQASAEDAFGFEPPIPFGVASFTTEVADVLGNDYTQAGGHPFSASADFELTRRFGGEGQVLQPEFIKDVVTDLPAGFIGNPQAIPQGDKCSGTAAIEADTFAIASCPRGSIVGFASVVLGITQTGEREENFPIYEIEPERGAPAQFVFYLKTQETLISLTPRLRASEDYAIRLETPELPKNPTIFSVEATLCSFGTNVRAPLVEAGHGTAPEANGCKPANQTGSEPANPEPFLTVMTQCSEAPPVTKLAVDSWENPGSYNADGTPDYSSPNWHTTEAVSPRVTGCGAVPFGPTVSFQPTSHRAEAPTGLDVSIAVPTEGLETPEGISQGALKQAVVTLPKGMAVNPSAADGLGACTAAQISLGTNEPVLCPESSKVGTAEVVTPLLELPLTGAVYLAKQGDNPFHSLLALYLVVESKDRGILVKIPGHVEPQADGQLIANFDENPQVPFSSLMLHFNSGNRAPLLNPPACGSYGITSRLSPWSAPTQPLVVTANFQITEGPGGGACPSGGLAPKLNAGVTNPLAGSKSPFVLDLSREEGSQRFGSLDLTLPSGLTAYLTGIPYCPDVVLAAIPSAEGTGVSQIASPSCPAASQIGTASVGAGGGPNPFYVNTGRVYLAGPYRGAPLSIAIVTPAVAGPFDLGSVVVRSAAFVDPETAQITVKSDPIPTILDGIPLDIRDIRVNVDRPDFMLAPTNCEQKSISATVNGETGGNATVGNLFQVEGCRSLAFKPKLQLSLSGSTKHAGHPALKAVLTYPKGGGYANIARAQVNLPHSEFIDQGNLDKTCTKPVLLAGNCTARSIYGKAKAWTPLLAKPLEGPVYLVGGYGYKLPALVAELNGQIRVVLKGKVDSGPNHGIRNTFEAVPDAPVEKFVLEMKGGKKYSLLENSENLCAKPQRAIARFTAQNGAVLQTKPLIANQCGKKKGTKKPKK